MANEIIMKKFCSQPFLTSTPIKSSLIRKKVKNTQSVELIKPSTLLNALLNREDQSNKLELKARTTKRGWSYFDDESSSSDEEENFSERAKNAGLKISSANLKRCVDIKEEERGSNKVVKKAKSKGRNKSTMSEGSCKTTEKKRSLIPLRKNVSNNCKKSFKVSPKKAKVPLKLTDMSVNSFQFEKFENTHDSVNISFKANDESKKKRTKNVIVDEHKSLETYFVPIKNKTKKKNVENVVENKAKNGSSSDTVNCNQVSSLHHTELELDCGEKVLFGCNDGKNDRHILSPIKSCKNIKEGNKTKIKVKNDIIPAKKMKVRNKLLVIEDPGKSDKKNASYQLFSDSKEQELLNSLDLTKDDISDKENHLNSVKDHSLLKQISQPQIKPVSQEEKPVLESMQEVKSSLATQENQNNEIEKENCLKDRQANTVNSTNGENKEKALEEKPCGKEESKAIDEPVNFRDCKGRLRKGSVFKSEAVVKKSILKSPNVRKTNNEKINTGVLCDDQIQNCEEVIHRNDKTTAASNAHKSKECNSHNINNDKLNQLPICGTSGVFRPFNNLSNLQEFKPGFSVAECWNLKNFKCGMLQLKPGSSHTSKTSDENRYFGGVVIKGKIKMKIGEIEIDLKEGDMNFVPPMTVWSVSNIEGMDAMMYYWCGRFRV